MDRPLILGTRGSPLALAQAHQVAAALEAAHGWAAGFVQILPVRTSGDREQSRPLADIGGKALWTKELDLALLAGETDFSVHSMKDVESERPDTLIIAAVMERADARDRLIGAASIEALPRGARIGTSSPRRAAQIRRLRPDLLVAPIRGNVETRLAKVAAGEFDATLLAAAGLDRLGRGDVGVAIAVETMLPAPAQAAIGVECRASDVMVAALLRAIDHAPSHRAVNAERVFTRALGGSCHSPVAALAIEQGDELWLRGEILSESGAERISGEARFAIDDAETPEALARELLGKAPEAIRRLFD
ncbi:MAG TPA: hydroxymethylbilane synthase [Sphingomicrobium sp.]|nr:hydroxymethylbilane synthase [Sphingomicrobium sp.]